MLEKWKEFEQIFILLSMLVLKLSFSMGCLFIVQCTEIQRISTWKKYNSFQISKSKSQNHSKNERARGTIVRTNSSSSFSFILLSMLVRLPFSMGYLFLEILDLILSKFPNIQRTRGTNKFDQIGDYPATNYPRQADKRVAL